MHAQAMTLGQQIDDRVGGEHGGLVLAHVGVRRRPGCAVGEQERRREVVLLQDVAHVQHVYVVCVVLVA